MSAERLRMDVIAANLANANTTRGINGQPYRRQEVVLSSAARRFGEVLGGVHGRRHRRRSDAAAPRLRPGPPGRRQEGLRDHAERQPGDRDGRPDHASRGYEANVTAMNAAKQMFTKTFDVLR